MRVALRSREGRAARLLYDDGGERVVNPAAGRGFADLRPVGSRPAGERLGEVRQAEPAGAQKRGLVNVAEQGERLFRAGDLARGATCCQLVAGYGLRIRGQPALDLLADLFVQAGDQGAGLLDAGQLVCLRDL